MSRHLPDLGDADWLRTPATRKTFAILDKDSEPSRIVGGAVRNALAGLAVEELDFATPLAPESVMRRAAEAGCKAVPTGIEHGTVTLVADGVPHQVTTLREDVETDGRHAVVRFGTDWTADARRRDFTVNALSVDAAGKVYDPLEGFADILARRVRFIGDPGQRIAEDRLRVLRFFRFNAEFGQGGFDPEGLSAAIRARNDLRELSAERIGQEMRRLASAPRAFETLGRMQDSGILGVILAGVAYLGPFERLLRFDPDAGLPLRLAAFGCRVEEDVERLTQRLRLSNAERDAMLAEVVAARRWRMPTSERNARASLYRLGPAAWPDVVALAFAWGTADADDKAWQALRALPALWPPPRFPLSGADVLGAGAAHGPAVGQILEALESWWIGQDFVPDATALRQRLQQMVTSAQ
ncbi:MAG: CCA tRNA nucleotidyltransferase [Bauldia sp.]|uniref:CCA tRNA nucleotidyltransferase n=1 Tax=Bauldia sp. TaxID=2575872 RepID=UPI001DD56A02|nr:CCA tRNA nucleotidyltransferase [Bauldia sp.]MCB1497986.1 CCA tRNA nucleotidyltransferase [Bauldia sp.]